MGTISQELEYLNETKNLIKQSIINKGVDVQDSDPFRSYVDKIANISTGTPINNQDKTITSNGTYTADEGYTGLGAVTVNVSGGSSDFSGIPFEVTTEGSFLRQASPFTFSSPETATLIPAHGLSYAFYQCGGIVSVNLSNVTSVDTTGLSYAFSGCSNLTSVDMSSLTSVGYSALSYAFSSCSNLTSVNLSNVTSVDTTGLSHAFSGCSNLTSVDMSSLTSVGNSGLNYAFQYCSSLTSVDLSNVTSASYYALSYAFSGCSNLTSLSFPALNSNSFGSSTSQFNGMLSGVNGCTVHFPSNLESVIGSWSAVTGGFGGKNTTILFDLPATT